MKKGRQFQTEGNGRIQEVAGASAFKTKPSQHLRELVCYLHPVLSKPNQASTSRSWCVIFPFCPQLVSKWKETDTPVSQVHSLHSALPWCMAFFYPKSSWSWWKHFLFLFPCNLKMNKSVTKSQLRDESPLTRNDDGTLIVCPMWAVGRGARRVSTLLC